MTTSSGQLAEQIRKIGGRMTKQERDRFYRDMRGMLYALVDVLVERMEEELQQKI